MADLDPLIRIRKHALEQKQKFLADLYRQAAELEDQKRNLVETLAEERKKVDEMGVQALGYFGHYSEAVRGRVEDIDDALKNRIIEFESGSAVLAASGTKILDEMAIALNKVGGKQVKIIGHTDSSGDANKNLILSKERAQAVKDYLIGKNIPADSLSVEGLGANKPVADNSTAEGRKKNRRIEFEVI